MMLQIGAMSEPYASDIAQIALMLEAMFPEYTQGELGLLGNGKPLELPMLLFKDVDLTITGKKSKVTTLSPRFVVYVKDTNSECLRFIHREKEINREQWRQNVPKRFLSGLIGKSEEVILEDVILATEALMGLDMSYGYIHTDTQTEDYHGLFLIKEYIVEDSVEAIVTVYLPIKE